MSHSNARALPEKSPSLLAIPPGAIDFEVGRIAFLLGRHADAVVWLESARRANANAANVEYLLGRAYVELANRSVAKREYTACLERAHNAEYP